MPNPIKQPVPLKVKGVDYTLMFQLGALSKAEDVSKRSLLTGTELEDFEKPRISLVCAMLYAALLPVQPDMTYAEASALVDEETLFEIWPKVIEAWVIFRARPESVKVADDANPTPGMS